MKSYSLYDLVREVNGGGFIPIGSTSYDTEAYSRMQEIEELIDCLLDDILRVYEKESYEASVQEAHEEAKHYLRELKETIEYWLDDEKEEEE